MELKLNSGDTITIPDGCRAVIKDKIITVEKAVQEFNDGDVLCCKYHEKNYYAIYKCKINNSVAYFYIFYNSSYYIFHYDDVFLIEGFTLATEEEKQMLLDALHADGKDWDAVNKKIVEYMWQPKDGEDYYVINTLFKVLRFTWQSYSFDFDLLKSGNCFKTEEDAKAKADEIIKIINK